MQAINSVVLCGGSGTRLWPLSRALYPKQFMDINGTTLFADTLARVKSLGMQLPPIIVCNEEHRFYVAAALQQSGTGGPILLEPQGRNTAPAEALAALQALENADDAILLILPSDHLIKPVERFAAMVKQARPAAAAGYIVTFGITPDHPATGYGYIQKGAALRINSPKPACCHTVHKFIEKPDSAAAQRLLDQGDCFWNSGMFLVRASVYLEELQRFAPQIFEHVKLAWQGRKQDKDFIRPEAEAFISCPADSIDYAVMEKTQKAAVMPLALQWNDLGSWEAFYQSMPQDADNNVRVGDVLHESASGCYLHSSGRLLAAIGVKDLAIVETADAVLAVPRARVQEVKKIVDMLKARHRNEFELHPLVYRPWGSYERLINGDRFQVKRMVVNPGAELSLQKHHHRAEHWVVVGGTAEVMLDDEVTVLTENQSVYIPLGSVHRLKNPGIIPLVMIEIQTGSYLGEDDIIRLHDEYGR